MSRSVVLTGGPGAGKSALSAHFARRFPHRFVPVPEAATQVYALRKTRWDKLDADGRREVQRHIYRLQLQQEQTLRQAHPERILLLDRGTVDGAAYWPDGPADYWQALGTSAQAELQRYDQVIWLQSSAAIGVYDGSHSNACRFEDAAAALDCGQRLRQVWQAHRHFHAVEAYPTLEGKIAAVERLLGLHNPLGQA